MDVELRHLRAFAAVARRRSFTRAADELVITQPSLSRTIAQLESALGVQLLDRSSRHVELTATGAEFLERVEPILAAVEQAVRTARQEIRIRLGFSWLLPDPWARDTTARFEAATGGRVDVVRCDDPLVAVLNAGVDVAVIRGRVDHPAVRVVHLFDEQRVAMCSDRSPLAERDTLDWSEVKDWPLVVNTVSGTTGPWSWPDGQRPEQTVPTTNFDEWLETIAADRGIGIVPDAAQRRGIHPAVRFVPLTNAPPSPVFLVVPQHGPQSVIRQFLSAATA